MPAVVRKLIAHLSRRERWQLYFLLVVMIVVAAVEVIGIASILPFMAVVTNPEVIHTNPRLNEVYGLLGFQSEQTFLTFLGFMVLGLLVFSNLIKAFGYWFTLRYNSLLNYALARRLLASYMARPYSFFLNRNTAELGKNVLTEANNVIIQVVSPLTDIISSSLVTLTIIVLLIVVNPAIALSIAAVLGGAYGTVYLLAHHKLTEIGQQQVELNFRKYKLAGEALSGIKDLKVLSREETFLGRFATYARCHATNIVRLGLIAEMPKYAFEIVAFGGILLVVLYLLGSGKQAEQLVPLLALYAFAGYRLMPALQRLFSAVTTLQHGVAALDVLHLDLTGEAGVPCEPEARFAAAAEVAALPFRERLQLRNISFRYEGAPSPSVRNIDLEIESNTTVGLVGPTGCGKTTLVDLILGLLSPSKGKLLVDGVEITADNLAAWQKNMGYVPQHIYISDDTITRNIAFGVPDNEIDFDAVRHAAQTANLAQFVETELPRGFDTEIGEHGVRLSGGQRQRIGIARALYRDPSILVMDEATSALDGNTEENVMHAVHNLSRKKTIILIAHRLTTVRECNVIFFLEQGSIKAKGCYDDLMQESSWFRTAAGS